VIRVKLVYIPLILGLCSPVFAQKTETAEAYEKNTLVKDEEQTYDVTTTYEEDEITTYTVTEIAAVITELEAQVTEWEALKTTLEAL